MEVKQIGVIGAGIMGHGIAQVSAIAGFRVLLPDIEEAFLQKARANIENSLGRMAKAGKVAQEKVARVLERIQTTTDLNTAVQDADLVIEAVPENLQLKKSILRIWIIFANRIPFWRPIPRISASQPLGRPPSGRRRSSASITSTPRL